MTADLRPASTVLVFRDSAAGPEVFMVRRHDNAAFMGGAYVFPGGAVDRADADAADPRWCDGTGHAMAQLAGLPAAEALAFHAAAVRELFEEAGVLLARDASGTFVTLTGDTSVERVGQLRRDVHAGALSLRDLLEREHLRMAADALTLCAHWVTPPVHNSRRFDTRFFAAVLPGGQHAWHDEHETTESRWTTASAAILAAQRGEITLPPPTWIMLREVESSDTVDGLLSSLRARTIQRREPQTLIENGERVFIMPGQPAGVGDPGGAETRFVLRAGRWQPQ